VTANWNGTYYDEAYSFPGPDGTNIGCADEANTLDSDFYVGCGAYVDNRSATSAIPGITITGVNAFNGNVHMGLMALSDGQVSLQNIHANNNGWHNQAEDPEDNTVWGSGAYVLSNDKGVTLAGTNDFNGNWDSGLLIIAWEAVTVSNLNAHNNQHAWGARLNNSHYAIHANVTMTGYVNTSGNAEEGLNVITNGTVTLANVNSSGNGGAGAEIIADSGLSAPSNVTIGGLNYFLGNQGGSGLTIESDGLITLSSIEAQWNSQNGVYLNNTEYENWNPMPLAGVVMTGTNLLSNNGAIGLSIDGWGNLMLSNITADRNTITGVSASTDDNSLASGIISITCGSMNGNGVYGYYLQAGTIVLSRVLAYDQPNFAVPLPIFIRTCP